MTQPHDAHLDVLSAVDDAIARSAAELLNVPHVVHVFDRVLGTPCAFGPFRSPVAASAFAEQFCRDVLGIDGDARSLRVDVVALQLPEVPWPAKRRWLPFRRRISRRSVRSRRSRS